MDSRYIRQEAFPLVGKEGQKKITSSSVAIVGCGALGSVAAELLARAGIGNLILIDRDVVELSNLQRQALYTEKDVSKPKASILRSHLTEINSSITVAAHDINLNFENIGNLLGDAGLVLDCTDNIDARLLVNEFCAKSKKTWMHSAAVQDKGTVLVILPEGPCFRCVFPRATQAGSCEELGILNSTSHIVASTLVVEAIKFLTGKPTEGSMLRFDVSNHTIDRISVKKDANCPVCKGAFSILTGKMPDFEVKECKTRKGWTVKPKSNTKLNLEGIKKQFKVVLDGGILLVIDCGGEIVVHGYGELLFKDLKDEAGIRKIAGGIYKAGGLKGWKQ
jgi:adenylyltransferase/sulfurtransferase